MTRKTVVIIAGWAHTAGDMAPLASALAPACEVRTLSPGDLFADGARALANREPGRAGLSYARALCERVSDLKPPFFLAGWSMGALMALEAVGRLSLAAEKMVLLGGMPRFCAGDGYTAGVPLRNLRVLQAGLKRDPAKALDAFYRDAAFPRIMPLDVAGKKTAGATAFGPACLSDGLLYLQETDVRDGLGNIRIPALVLHGRQDRIVPWEAGEWLGRQLPQGVFVRYEDAGHDLLAAESVRVCLKIRDFLKL